MSTSMDDARKETRAPLNKKGIIRFGAAGHELGCLVTDLTPSGAGITLASAFGVPNAFQMKINDEPVEKHCRVVWAQGNRLGVLFE